MKTPRMAFDAWAKAHPETDKAGLKPGQPIRITGTAEEWVCGFAKGVAFQLPWAAIALTPGGVK